MNTIKIKLSTSGRVAALDKNFPLYCGQFQNVLLNIYVPTEILAPDFEIQHYIGNTSGTTEPSNSIIPQTELQTALTDFVVEHTYDPETQTGRQPVEGDVIFYTYTTGDTYYRATYTNATIGTTAVGYRWLFTEVPYFAMGNFSGTNVKVGVIATESNGTQFKSKSYYCRYVKTLTSSQDGIQYALYERKMPREFTATIGSGQAARTVIINVVNSSQEKTNNVITAKVENIITSQTVGLDVLPSTALDEDEPIDATAQEEIWEAINSVAEDLAEKQDKKDADLSIPASVQDPAERTVVDAINDLESRKQNKVDTGINYKSQTTVVGAINKLGQDKQESTDNSLLTDSNTIVGAINEVDAHADAANTQAGANAGEITSLKGRMDAVELVADGAASQAETNRQDIADLKPRMTAVEGVASAANQRSIQNAQDISSIEAIIGTGEDFIGTKTIDYDPTLPENYAQLTSDLNSFVQTTKGRAPKGGDSVIVVDEVTGQTDRNFKYIYTGTEWRGYEIPPMELASYGSAGIVSGTFRVTSPQTPQDKTYDTLVYIDGGEIKNIYIKIDGVYEDFRTVILGIIGSVSNIVSGATPVGEAQVANKDSAGNNIATQFANIISGASKVGAAAAADAATAATNDGAGNNIALQFANILSGATKVGASAAADAAEVATKDSAGNNIATQFANILSGTTQVGRAAYAAAALKATQDALGNDIVNTYLTQNLGATKAYVKDYALPKEFNNVLYLSASGFGEEIPTTPASGIQFTATSSSIGETTIFSANYTLGDLKFELSSKNSASARFFVEASGLASSVQFKLSTYAAKDGGIPVLLSVELLAEQELPTTLTTIDFGAPFASLGNTTLELEEDDIITMTLVAIMSESATTTFDVYSNSTYPSRINLNTTTQTITYRVTELGQALYLPLSTSALTVTNGDAYFTTNNSDFLNLVSNMLDGEFAVDVPDLSLVTGITSGSHIYINNIALSSAKNTHAELGDFEAFKRQNGAYLLFGVLRNSATEIAIDAPNINTIPKTAKETKQVAANAWTADANIAPFAYSYTTTFSQDNTIFGKVTLVASPIVLCKYGIVIGEISGTSVTFYAQELPLEAVGLTLLFENEKEAGGNRVTDQYGNPVTDENGNPVTAD